VVLHGDAAAGHAPDLRTPFVAVQAAARAHGFAVLAPRCPAEHGCTRGSYWQWTQGSPGAWLREQVRAVTAAYPIDPERVFLLGWSGGASYAGSVVHELGERFAAVAFVGGGMPPEPLPTACPHRLPPAYFLVGDKNPFHHLAQALRGLYTRCGGEARWQLLPGADHDGEHAALRSPARAAALLDWLSQQERRRPAP
jgi:poly(3-hydroxybutyrate) depolymerase